MTTQVNPQPIAGRPAARPSWIRTARRNGLQLGIFGVFILLWIVFIIGAPNTFLRKEIYGAFMSSIPFFGIVALPLTLVVIAREIDLSFGSIMAVGTMAFAMILTATNSILVALLGALVVGFLAGLLNGIIVVRLNIPSLIATIGTMFFWRGVILVVTNGQGVSFTPIKESLLRNALVGRVAGYWPTQMIWMIIIAVCVWVLLNRHKFGAHVYLIGDNENSARLMGVNVPRTRMLIFAVTGLAAAFAGIMASLEVSYFWPATLGEGYLMRTLAAVFLGGTSVYGGTGTIFGTFIACFIIGAIEAGTVAIGLTGYWTQLIFGLIIIISVAMHTILRRRIS
jgi:simple sugar transport system permease protein